MATKTALQPALTASGSLITWSPFPPPPTAFAKPGTLKFEMVPIVNSIFFVPAACSVKDDTGTNVPLTSSSAAGLSFAAVSGRPTPFRSLTLFRLPVILPAQGFKRMLQEQAAESSSTTQPT